MTGRMDEALAIEALLKENQTLAEKVGSRIYRGRLSPTSADDGDDIRIYAPRTSGRVVPGEEMPEFDTDITIVIEVRVIGASDWDLRADDLSTEVMKTLFNSDAWLRRFEEVPSYDIAQFKDASGEDDVVGEMITFQLSPVNTLSFGPEHDGPISAVHVQMLDDDDEIILEQHITA